MPLIVPFSVYQSAAGEEQRNKCGYELCIIRNLAYEHIEKLPYHQGEDLVEFDFSQRYYTTMITFERSSIQNPDS